MAAHIRTVAPEQLDDLPSLPDELDGILDVPPRSTREEPPMVNEWAPGPVPDDRYGAHPTVPAPPPTMLSGHASRAESSSSDVVIVMLVAAVFCAALLLLGTIRLASRL